MMSMEEYIPPATTLSTPVVNHTSARLTAVDIDKRIIIAMRKAVVAMAARNQNQNVLEFTVWARFIALPLPLLFQ